MAKRTTPRAPRKSPALDAALEQTDGLDYEDTVHDEDDDDDAQVHFGPEAEAGQVHRAVHGTLHGPQDGDTEVPIHDEQTMWDSDRQLDAPPPRPGYEQRWVRMSIRGTDDAANLSKRKRRGWEPRRLDTLPAGYEAPSLNVAGSDVIAVPGLVLCEMPLGQRDKRRSRIQARTDQLSEAVDRELQAAEIPGHPIVARRHTTVTHRRVPRVAD